MHDHVLSPVLGAFNVLTFPMTGVAYSLSLKPQNSIIRFIAEVASVFSVCKKSWSLHTLYTVLKKGKQFV